MRVTQKMTTDTSVYNINSGRRNLDHLNEIISSGQTINRPSDNPVTTKQILDIENQIKASSQYISNIKQGETWIDMTATSLQGMAAAMTQIKTIAGSAEIAMGDPTKQQEAISSLQALRDQMIDYGNQPMGDQYLFGGFNNGQPPFPTSSFRVHYALNNNTISDIDTSSLYVGMPVSGTGLPSGTTVSAVYSSSSTANLTAGSVDVGAVDITGLVAGTAVSGEGIVSGTTIASITPDSNDPTKGTIRLSSPALSTSTGGTLFFGKGSTTSMANLTAGSTSVSGVSITGLAAGTSISGPGILAGTTVAGITPDSNDPTKGTIILSSPATTSLSGSQVTFGKGVIQLSNASKLEGDGYLTFKGNFTGTGDTTYTTVSKTLQIPVAISGGDILRGGTPPPSGIISSDGEKVDIIKTIDTVINAIANKDVTKIAEFTKAIDKGVVQIQSALSVTSLRKSRLDNVLQAQTTNNTNLLGIRSNFQDVDYTAYITKLNAQQQSFQASLQSTSKISSLSLLDYL